MLTLRSRISLAQYLSQFTWEELDQLFRKRGLSTPPTEDDQRHLNIVRAPQIEFWLERNLPEVIEGVLEELARNHRTWYRLASPKYVHEERSRDLQMCLQLDGYLFTDGALTRTEPTLGGHQALEDELAQALQRSGLARAGDVEQLLEQSASDFRGSPANFVGALTNARVALQTVATEISLRHSNSHPRGFDVTKWGQVVTHLRTTGIISAEEEKGIAGVFTFVSPGAHNPIGLTEAEFVRLGRSLSVGMIYFLVKRWTGN